MGLWTKANRVFSIFFYANREGYKQLLVTSCGFLGARHFLLESLLTQREKPPYFLKD